MSDQEKAGITIPHFDGSGTAWTKTTTGVHFAIERVIIFRERRGMDFISFELTAETARRIHGSFYDFFEGANLRLEVTRNRGEEVLADLGISPDIIEVIDVNPFVNDPPKFSKPPPKSA